MPVSRKKVVTKRCTVWLINYRKTKGETMLQLTGSRYINNIIMALMRQVHWSTFGRCCICDGIPGNHRILDSTGCANKGDSCQ